MFYVVHTNEWKVVERRAVDECAVTIGVQRYYEISSCLGASTSGKRGTFYGYCELWRVEMMKVRGWLE